MTSLDHRWRTQVAKRLVEEAEHRQIIVFTHDLIFVNDLIDMAEQKKRALQLVTVSRGARRAGMTGEGLPWKGKSIEDRIDKLEKATSAAKKLYEANKEGRIRVWSGCTSGKLPAGARPEKWVHLPGASVSSGESPALRR